MQATEALAVGTPAPEFSLKGPGGQPVQLSDYRGKKNVVLVFFPLAFSPVCSHQLPDLEQHAREIEALDAALFGVSIDSHYSNTAFAKQLGLSFPLLSDLDRKASVAYGVLQPEKGYSGRATFVIDKQGRIAHRDVAASPGDLAQVPSPEKVIAALRRLS
jgi:peroxiredoxin (alkyl hydroperoxide reductase subunit C)